MLTVHTVRIHNACFSIRRWVCSRPKCHGLYRIKTVISTESNKSNGVEKNGPTVLAQKWGRVGGLHCGSKLQSMRMSYNMEHRTLCKRMQNSEPADVCASIECSDLYDTNELFNATPAIILCASLFLSCSPNRSTIAHFSDNLCFLSF